MAEKAESTGLQTDKHTNSSLAGITTYCDSLRVGGRLRCTTARLRFSAELASPPLPHVHRSSLFKMLKLELQLTSISCNNLTIIEMINGVTF